MIVEHVDFWAVPVTDMERSKRFYGETLGLPDEPTMHGFPEFKLGDNVCLYLLQLENIGGAFRGPHDAGFALRVPDVAEAAPGLEEKGVEFNADVLDTASATWPSSTTPTGNQIVLHRRYAP